MVMNKALQLAVVGEGEEPHQSPFNQNETLSFCQRIISALRAEFNIQGFPVFGTLLGLYRDGELMKYDKDSDLGVIYDERYNIGTMIEVLNQKYGVLCADKVFLEEQHLRYCVGVYDKDSGAACDIFFYHRNDSKYETGISRTGSKLLWEHDLFDLEERVFSGYTYLCPTNIEHYLEETYGADWREPISMWDSLVSCPNLKKESQILVANFACQRLYVSLIYGDIAKATYYVEKLISRWPGILDAQTMDNLKKKITKYEE